MLPGARAGTHLNSHNLFGRQCCGQEKGQQKVGFSPVQAGHLQLPVPLGWPWLSQPRLRAVPLPAGSQPFHCLYCSASFCFPGALQNHVMREHFRMTESTFTCELCGELFPSQGELEEHNSAEHPKVVFSQATQIVQVKSALCHSLCSCSSVLPLQPSCSSQTHPVAPVTPSAP